MTGAGEHPRLAGGAIAASHQDAVDRDAAAGEQVEQRAPGLVVADESDRQRPSAQGVQIGDRVAAAAGHQLLAVVAEDQHRRLSADAFRSAADEAIRDQVAEHQDRLVREPVDQLEQTSRIGDARSRRHGRRRYHRSVKQVATRLADRIRRQGPVPFAAVMEEALYGAGGYYTRDPPAIGADGDYVTGSSLSPLFGRATARVVERVATALGRPADYLEIGYGGGEHLATVASSLAGGGGRMLAWDRVAREVPPGVRRLTDLGELERLGHRGGGLSLTSCSTRSPSTG